LPANQAFGARPPSTLLAGSGSAKEVNGTTQRLVGPIFQIGWRRWHSPGRPGNLALSVLGNADNRRLIAWINIEGGSFQPARSRNAFVNCRTASRVVVSLL
jgi:hypothetical protein